MMGISPYTKKLFLLLSCLFLLLSGDCPGASCSRLFDSKRDGSSRYRDAFPIVEPSKDHTKLVLVEKGLEVISRITTPISVISVIGPYRSGKSFLLNQLLSLPCSEGFGVGHTRDTKTKGIWVWGEPIETKINGVKTSVLYFDTEGFESIGKSNVYDDRIFALAAIMSSILIYNLPEMVREADIARLSFAVELAEEFYSRVKGRESYFQPAKLLWLIQRDFLEGKSVQQMVNEALQRVPNTGGSKDVEQVNKIRDSLAIMAENSSAFSLPQPHLHRTKLCEMKDEDLDREYVKRREHLKQIINSMIQLKIVQGKPLDGKELVSLLRQTLEALNKGEFPSAGSIVDVFNRAVVERCMKIYNERMSDIRFPVIEERLKLIHDGIVTDIFAVFEKERFGKHYQESTLNLQIELEKAFDSFVLQNEFKSTKACEALFSECEETLDELRKLRLPTMAKFEAEFAARNKSFHQGCIGPSKASYQQHMQKMLRVAKSEFISSYNNTLLNWLVVFSLGLVIIGRFILKFFLLEAAAWAAFIFLETYTRIFWSSETLFYNPVWQSIVTVWEAIVYSPIIDLDRWAIPIISVSVTAIVLFRIFRLRKRYPMPLLPSTNASRSRNRRQE